MVVVVASPSLSPAVSRPDEVLEHRPEPQLGRLAHQLQRPVLVLDARELDDDGVALAGDLGLGHAEGVDPVRMISMRLVERSPDASLVGASTTDAPPWRSRPSSGLLPADQR